MVYQAKITWHDDDLGYQVNVSDIGIFQIHYWPLESLEPITLHLNGFSFCGKITLFRTMHVCY